MAKIDWTDQFLHLMDYHIGNASIEFGRTTAMRWAKEIEAFEKNVCQYPTSYSPERLLLDRDVLYRRCHIMNRRFKIIYNFDEIEDTVHLIDIWDTRMNPKALVRRIK